MPNKQERIRSLFALSDNEKNALEKYQVSEAERGFFELFRQSFLFSSGELGLQIFLLLIAVSYSEREILNVAESIQISVDAKDEEEVYEVIGTLLALLQNIEGIDSLWLEDLKQIPHYLFFIEAPRNHVKKGKKTNFPDLEIERISGIFEPLARFIEQFSFGKTVSSISVLTEFLSKDEAFIKKIRATGISLHASFFRELVLSISYDDLFAPGFLKLIEDWRSIFSQYKSFLVNQLLPLKIDLLEDFYEWEDAESYPDIVSNKNKSIIEICFESAYNRPPDPKELNFIVTLYGVVKGWQQHYPNQDFFELDEE